MIFKKLKEEKVFCNECRWYKTVKLDHPEFVRISHQCHHPNEKVRKRIVEDTFLKRGGILYDYDEKNCWEECSIKNHENSCNDFEKKGEL